MLNNRWAPTGPNKDKFILEHHAITAGGLSGCPVFDRQGNVIAIHVAVHNRKDALPRHDKAAYGFAFAIRADKLAELLP